MKSICLLAALGSACTLIYELLIAQTVSFFAGNQVVWYSVIVGLYLAALGAGAALTPFVLKERSAWKSVALVELLLALLGAAAVPFTQLGYLAEVLALKNDEQLIAVLSFFPVGLLTAAAVGVLAGLELPILIALGKPGRSTNVVLAFDYFGSLLGAVLFPIVLLARFELVSVGLITALANAGLAAFAAGAAPKGNRSPLILFTAVGAACVLIFGLASGAKIEQRFLKHYYYHDACAESWKDFFGSCKNVPRIDRFSSPYQKIDFVRELQADVALKIIGAYSSKFKNEPDYPQGLRLYLNGDVQFFSSFDEFYHEWFAHVPIARFGRVPRRVLIMGGGDGLLLKELLKYREIETITLVEIDPEMIRLGKNYPALVRMNKDSLSDPRADIRIDDGYRFARTSRESFDAIYLDFPYPSDFNLSRLYSREFYSFLRNRLAAGGFIVQQASGLENLSPPNQFGIQSVSEGNLWNTYYSTIKSSGYASVLPYLINLENDNPMAIALIENDPQLRELQEVPEESRRAGIRRVLREQTYMLQMSFLMLSKEIPPSIDELHFPNVDLNALTEARVKLAFQTPFNLVPNLQPELINSISRPTLPELPLLSIRVPTRSARQIYGISGS